jgi:hypothetical protein
MITQIFDKGWGSQYPLKQFERHVVNRCIQHFVASSSRVVMINSVWYTDEYHQSVMTWLRNNHWDQIVLIAMLDAAIPHADKYAEFNRPVTEIGFYPGVGQIDFCSVFVDHFMDKPRLSDLCTLDSIDTAYMCLMRKPHWHRKKLYREMQLQGVLDHGLVSMGSESGAIRTLSVDTESDNLAPNAEINHYGVPNDIVSLGHPDNWARCFLNVVSETFYDINLNHFVSEKIYKPIVGCRPFLVYDPDGGAQWLHQRGFETYIKDFADISDLDLSNPNNISKFLKVLHEQGPKYWQKRLLDLWPKIVYNRQRFHEYVTEQNALINQGIPCPI